MLGWYHYGVTPTFIIEPEKNTDAVNVSQLKAAKTEVEAGRNVTVEHRLHG